MASPVMFRTTADSRGLRRTLMRALALSIVLEHRAERPEAAASHLREFLRLLDETPYTRALVREGEACAAVLGDYLDSAPDVPCRERAQSLLDAIRIGEDAEALVLSERESDILQTAVRAPGRQADRFRARSDRAWRAISPQEPVHQAGCRLASGGRQPRKRNGSDTPRPSEFPRPMRGSGYTFESAGAHRCAARRARLASPEAETIESTPSTRKIPDICSLEL